MELVSLVPLVPFLALLFSILGFWYTYSKDKKSASLQELENLRVEYRRQIDDLKANWKIDEDRDRAEIQSLRIQLENFKKRVDELEDLLAESERIRQKLVVDNYNLLIKIVDLSSSNNPNKSN